MVSEVEHHGEKSKVVYFRVTRKQRERHRKASGQDAASKDTHLQ
jgi:hypothetical protein